VNGEAEGIEPEDLSTDELLARVIGEHDEYDGQLASTAAEQPGSVDGDLYDDEFSGYPDDGMGPNPGDSYSSSVEETAGDGSSGYPEGARPSAEEIAAARETLAAAGVDVSGGNPEPEPSGSGSGMDTDDLEAVQDNLYSGAEDAALLSNIAAMDHNTQMGIIGNMR
jgi:hypothetical protein